ncbi:ead/Ea22-like family protein [Glutamicibacter creatinolyticus]|uniref:ead/Ea22-like family protein n=1 Tax=Glutamicibacter creatinolyticus TaxID=162496 RepID=UPI0032167240
MTKELDQLRQVAERATPGPWRFDTDSEEDYEVGIPYSEWPQTLYGPKNSCPSEWAVRVGDTHQVDEINELTWEDVNHIATFDPSTVLALIERVEAAERCFDEADSIKIEHEGAIQRVRELHKPTRDPFGESCAVCVGDSRRNPYPCATIRALDGGEQK